MSPCHDLEQLLVDRDSFLSVKPNKWMHLPPFIPVSTGSGAGMQSPLANIHWRFLLKSEMIGASK